MFVPVTGIYTRDVLDRESQSSYWLTVYAKDGGAVPLWARIEVGNGVFSFIQDIKLAVIYSRQPRAPLHLSHNSCRNPLTSLTS